MEYWILYPTAETTKGRAAAWAALRAEQSRLHDRTLPMQHRDHEVMIDAAALATAMSGHLFYAAEAISI